MVHPLVEQLRFARSEFRRAIDGVTEEEAQRRFLPMNCISWNVGHLVWQEQRYWVAYGQGQMLNQDIDEAYRYGAPGTTPGLAETLAAWETITKAADPWLDTITTKRLESHLERDGKPTEYVWGSLLLRMIYHYWYHAGENMAIRQNLRHSGLPDFVGDIDHEAPYRA